MAIGPSNRGGFTSCLLSSAIGLALAIPAAVNAAPSGRQIEEVVVTAERQEASVQDTSISITAFTSEMLEDFGIKDQTDLQNFIPATVILPYDASVRGVGRNFRSLGGDPGISTYINGVYSEDLYTATIGSFWDMERIEVLRGPQGTLYGRNAVGGAMNFIFNRPSHEFDYKFKAMAGNYDAKEFYGMVNGSLIEDVLSGRFVFSNRDRDGYIEEKGIGDDLDSRGEENYALQLNWTPMDNLEVNVRANRANVYRVMGGADGGGLVAFRGDSTDGQSRDLNTIGGYYVVDPTITDPTTTGFLDPSNPVFQFTNPTTGQVVNTQKRRIGIDLPPAGDNDVNRFAVGGDSAAHNECLLDPDDIDGDDLCAFTNGGNFERFHQQGVQFDVDYDINSSLSLKYIYGFNKLSYKRITEDDNGFSTVNDRQFYVNHEAQYESHELQAFFDINENLSFTSGIFFYDAVIDQRGDFYNANIQDGTPDRYSTGPSFDPTSRAFDPVGAAAAAGLLNGVIPFLADTVDLYTAKKRCLENSPLASPDCATPNTPAETATDSEKQSLILGAFRGDPGGNFPCDPNLANRCLDLTHGIDTAGSELLYATKTVRDSTAVYTQGVWDINEKFTLTFGLRWAEDEVQGEENLWRTLQLADPGAFGAAFGLPYAIAPNSPYYNATKAAGGFATNLAEYNVVTGNLDPVTLEPVPGRQPIPALMGELSIFRHAERKDDEVTWRINLDWDVTDNSMMYFSATTGYRGGGYNLVFFSQTMTYDPEELIAYEIGYKGNLLDNTLQLNASTYLYDYESIHTFVQEISAVGGTSASVLPAPGADIYGFEAEVLWLATDRITVGGNVSFTPSEYSESFVIGDGGDIRCPNSVIPTLDCRLDVKGNQVLNVPDHKGSMWGAYQLPLGENGNIEFLLSGSWIDESFNSSFETDFDRSPGYKRFDFRTTWTSPSEQWVVTGFISNLTDEVGVRQIETLGEAEGFRRVGMVTEPRMYGVEVTYSMGTL